jgi:hypothetical protein
MSHDHPTAFPLFQCGETIDTVVNWGLGVDSTAFLVKMLDDPHAYGVDLARTVVLHQATGSEWPRTRELAETYALPLLRRSGVRLVQLARGGQHKAAGITVLSDTRQPHEVVDRGEWTLWEEYETNGTVPQQAGSRLCSLRAKGEVGDRWIAGAIDRPFRQFMGFNADEEGRKFRDQAAAKNPLRTGWYPLIDDWRWGRERCEEFLRDRFGVTWDKSYCTFCCYPVSMGALPAHLARMRQHPDIAGEVLRLEYTAMGLNPNARLFGRRSLLEQFDPDRADDRRVLTAFEDELDCPWALYHVRRILPASAKDPGMRGRAKRSVQRIDIGRPGPLGRRLKSLSDRHGVPVESDPYGRTRAWVRTRGTVLPVTEELFVTGPARVRDKQTSGFEAAWRAAVGDPSTQLPTG